MSSIQDIIQAVESLNIDDEWSNAEHYNTVRLHYDPKVEPSWWYEYLYDRERLPKVPGKRGRPGFKHNKIYGVYRWLYQDDQGLITYVGKSEKKPNSSILKRQDRHLLSFEGHIDSESSGRKLREFMLEKGLQTAEFVIQYIDLTTKPSWMISLLEDRSIEHFQPILNSEIGGYGVR